jgi:hypothetical protein
MPEWIDLKISLGNILTIGSVIIGLTSSLRSWGAAELPQPIL